MVGGMVRVQQGGPSDILRYRTHSNLLLLLTTAPALDVQHLEPYHQHRGPAGVSMPQALVTKVATICELVCRQRLAH
jgi:hypothetical protein